jgi:hypothetical protein
MTVNHNCCIKLVHLIIFTGIICDLWPQTSKPTLDTNGYSWIRVNQDYESSSSGFDTLVLTVRHVAFLSKDGIIECLPHVALLLYLCQTGDLIIL